MDKGSAVLAPYWTRVPMGAVGQKAALGDPAWPFTLSVRAWRSEIAEELAPGYWVPQVRFHEGIAFVKAVARNACLRHASDRAKSMISASVGFENVRDGVVVEAGRPSRSQQSHAEKPPKTLARRPPSPKQHADTDEACGRRGCIFSPQGIEALPVRL
ncbi:hypothetical protein SVAN01_04859 [Stagonosporopsis vannaccii]|nr:hypothetical protein SVAN01_04859 [Stagonosporopsis vannaccii]